MNRFKKILEMHALRVFCLAALVALPFLLTSCPEPQNGGSSFEGCGRSGFYCPDGFACNETTGECECDGTIDACGEGAVCDTDTGRCVCSLDECCPDGYAFNVLSMACVCASDECCPPDFEYDEEEGMCVCAIDICCPPGFDVDQDGRCLCTSNAACGDGFICNLDSGECRCISDDSCPDGAFCNDFGFCQERAACTSSFDCPDRMVCDINQGFCLTGYCTIDADCPFGRICENNACARGCRTSDDCWMAQACIEGQCRGGICDREEQCGLAEYCNVAGSCVREEGNFCKMPCTMDSHCPDGSCVTQMVEGQQEPYCGVDCDPDVGCPNGYFCGGTYITGCEGMGFLCNEFGLDECVQVEVHNNEPPVIWFCGTNGQPAPAFHTCGPEFGTCSMQPGAGQTTRPGPGAVCHTLCRDGLICANAGMGYRCYASCPTGTCAGSFVCRPAENGIDMICVPP